MKTMNEFIKENEENLKENDASVATTTVVGGQSGAMKGDWVSGTITRMLKILRRKIRIGK